MAPVLRITPIGNLGNQMFQLLWAMGLQARVPNLRIQGVSLPAWGIETEPWDGDPAFDLVLRGQHVAWEPLITALHEGTVRRIDFRALGFDLAHYPDVAQARTLFPARPDLILPTIAPNTLVINVRAGEVLGDVHEDYGPLPTAFYRALIDASDRPVVFMGQLGDDAYSQHLRTSFPQARFLPSMGVMEDFELMRRAGHLVIGVSTFSWLAAWLSEAHTIHLPMAGILNPRQRPDIRLLPLEDPRYRPYGFPVRHWHATEADWDQIRSPEPVHWTCTTQEAARQQRLGRSDFPWRKARYTLRWRWQLWRLRRWGIPANLILRMD